MKFESLEQAQEDPSQLSQDTIVQQLDPQEQARLDKVRNIGIAVREVMKLEFEQSLTGQGTHRQWQNHSNRTCPILHWSHKLHP